MEQKNILLVKMNTLLNAALVINTIPVIGLVGVPKKIDFFILMVWRKLFN